MLSFPIVYSNLYAFIDRKRGRFVFFHESLTNRNIDHDCVKVTKNYWYMHIFMTVRFFFGFTKYIFYFSISTKLLHAVVNAEIDFYFC